MKRSDEDWEALWETIGSNELCEEFRERLGCGDSACVAVAAECVPDEPDWGESEEDELFSPLDAWDRAELLKAIREDDGRRCIDVLKRAAA